MNSPLQKPIIWITVTLIGSLVLPSVLGDRNIFNCTFEAPVECDFRQDLHDDLDWDLFHLATVPASLVATYVDHTFGSSREEGGHFARLYAQGGDTGKASIITPMMNLTQGSAEVSFFYHLWDPDLARDQLFTGQLNVYACNKRLVWTKSGNLGDIWYKAIFRFECNRQFSLTFEGFIGGLTPDIAIDDVTITDCFNETITTTTITQVLPTTNLTTMATPRVTTMLPWVPLPGTTQSSSVPGASESPDYTTYDTLSVSVSPTLPEHPVSPNGEGVISEEVAVSLVLVAVLLFASTCLLLFFTLILHCCKCCCHGNSPPAHIIYHAPSYINPDARLAPEEYMLLNFNGRRVSAATTAGTGFFTLSAEGVGTAKSRDRSSFGSASTFAPTTRLLGDRRTSKTLPGVREIKNFLHDFNFKRARSFSSHVTAAEIAAVRRRVETANMQHRHRNRTRSTIVFDRSGSMVRPVSEISEHFYYSLFPEPNPDYVMETESNQSSIGDLRMGVPARVSTIELLSHDRFHRRRTNSNNLRIIWTGEQQFMSTTAPQASADVAPEIQDATPSEMIENEIYECYSDDEVKC